MYERTLSNLMALAKYVDPVNYPVPSGELRLHLTSSQETAATLSLDGTNKTFKPEPVLPLLWGPLKVKGPLMIPVGGAEVVVYNQWVVVGGSLHVITSKSRLNVKYEITLSKHLGFHDHWYIISLIYFY